MKKEQIGLGIVGIGVVFSILSNFLCNSLCKGQCIKANTSSCLFLFLFAAICVIVSGTALMITLRDKNGSSV